MTKLNKALQNIAVVRRILVENSCPSEFGLKDCECDDSCCEDCWNEEVTEWVARLFCLAPDMLDIIRRLAMYKPEICPFCYEVKGMHTETCIAFLATRIIDIVDKSYKQEEE